MDFSCKICYNTTILPIRSMFMKAVKLAGLAPASDFAYFEKLCSIPHGSRNTKAISDYLVSFAEEQ